MRIDLNNWIEVLEKQSLRDSMRNGLLIQNRSLKERLIFYEYGTY